MPDDLPMTVASGLATAVAFVWSGMGDYLILPASRHSLEALENSAILLTIATTAGS